MVQKLKNDKNRDDSLLFSWALFIPPIPSLIPAATFNYILYSNTISSTVLQTVTSSSTLTDARVEVHHGSVSSTHCWTLLPAELCRTRLYTVSGPSFCPWRWHAELFAKVIIRKMYSMVFATVRQRSGNLLQGDHPVIGAGIGVGIIDNKPFVTWSLSQVRVQI